MKLTSVPGAAAGTGTASETFRPEKFGCLDARGIGLLELPCDERYGLVFVRLDRTPR